MTRPEPEASPNPSTTMAGRRLPRGRTIGKAVAWAVLLLGCYFLAQVGRVAGVPAAGLLAGLLVGTVVALVGRSTPSFPRPAARASQALVGVVMGSYLRTEALAAVASTVLPLVVVTVATVGIALAVAGLLARYTTLPRADATLGTIPGGSAAIISSADDLGVDSRFVAFAQYLRVGLVAVSAPAVALAVASNPVPDKDQPIRFPWPDLHHLVERPTQQLGALVVLAVICLTGAVLGRRLRLPAAVLLGPMLVAAVFSLTHAASGFAPSGPLKEMVFVAVGLEIGLRFTRTSVRRYLRLLPHLAAATAVLCLACAGLAWVLGAGAGLPFLGAYLATTPGGINAVLATAASTGTNVPLVSTVQSVRLFAVVLAMPPIMRWLTASTASVSEPRQPASAASARPT